jgi:hypothetical protein
MAYFVGLDVSVKETAVCVVDEAGKVICEQKVPSDPDDKVCLFDKASGQRLLIQPRALSNNGSSETFLGRQPIYAGVQDGDKVGHSSVGVLLSVAAQTDATSLTYPNVTLGQFCDNPAYQVIQRGLVLSIEVH